MTDNIDTQELIYFNDEDENPTTKTKGRGRNARKAKNSKTPVVANTHASTFKDF